MDRNFISRADYKYLKCWMDSFWKPSRSSSVNKDHFSVVKNTLLPLFLMLGLFISTSTLLPPWIYRHACTQLNPNGLCWVTNEMNVVFHGYRGILNGHFYTCLYGAIVIGHHLVLPFGNTKRQHNTSQYCDMLAVHSYFMHYITVARCYKSGVHCYNDVASASWVLSMDTTSP